MGGLSEAARRVSHINANWVASPDGGDGVFSLLVVTDDGQRHVVPTTPRAITALTSLMRTGVVFIWDDSNRTLVAGNLVGEWLPTDLTLPTAIANA